MWGRFSTTPVQISQVLTREPEKAGQGITKAGLGQTRLEFVLSHLNGLPIERKLPIVPVGQNRRGLIGIVEPWE
jgi:hypothetical protein